MNLKEKNPWKACLALILIVLIIMSYIHYPNYDTTEARAAALSASSETDVTILDEVTVEGCTVCQIRTGGRTGCALFRQTLGKTRFLWMATTSSDRLVKTFAAGNQTWLILICDQPNADTAVMHFYDHTTGLYSTADPIDLEGKHLLVIPHQPDLGSYDHTVYYDSEGNPL